jgi:hypothetical protein
VEQTHWMNMATVLSIAALAACRGDSGQAAEAGKLTRTPAAPAAPASWTLDAGRQITAATRDTISSRTAKVGDGFTATVVSDVQDARGRVAIPAGAVVYGTVTAVKRATSSSNAGTLTLAVSGVTVHGKSYPIDASIDAIATERQGQGVTGGDVAKVGVGAAAGAIVGQIIDKNTKGTVIGAVVGAAAGAGYAALTKDADVRIPEGTHIVITLQQRLTITGS